MLQNGKIWVGKGADPVYLLPTMANRHGLIAGATGTGKTVTLKVIAEAFSDMGVPVFAADIKGDLAGIAVAGTPNPKVEERLRTLGIEGFQYAGFPVRFWDLFGEAGHPVRATVSDMGALLLSRMLGLNDTQAGVLNITFRVADDNGLLLLDLADLRAMLQYVGDHASELTTRYGNVSTQSVGAILRALLTLEDQGGAKFFGEPALDISDWMQVDPQGKGYINILHSEKLYMSPALYSTFLLWMLSELFEVLPEAGDLQKPRLVFFFDEAHLLFKDAPKALLEKIQQVVRLIRSKGVGVYFVTQVPSDVPQEVLGQLGNRVQHALRAFTPADQKFVRAAARSFRANPNFDSEKTILELGTGEALVSFLDADGKPSIAERAMILPPQSSFSAIDDRTRGRIISSSLLGPKYENAVNRKSAFEMLQSESPATREASQERPTAPKRVPARTSGRKPRTPLEATAGSMMTTIGREVGRQIIRGILGSILKR
ncbi:MAG: AAA-like domain protein [Candidatus Latescibacteria bacterium ADurb.Bin168]|nr:MAG: AAA-like domain protein [Candidatus Latescibacteria bacterium ADurb.Bin168]